MHAPYQFHIFTSVVVLLSFYQKNAFNLPLPDLTGIYNNFFYFHFLMIYKLAQASKDDRFSWQFSALIFIYTS